MGSSDHLTYWERRARDARSGRAVPRRRFVGAAGIGAAGLASWAAVGCGGDDDDDDTGGDDATSTPTGADGSTPGTSAPPDASSGEVNISQASLDTQPGDPQMATSGIQQPITFGQATALYYGDVDGVVKPAVAEAIELADDGMSYTITVRPDITFTNGDPLTAEDVAFSIDRMVQISATKALWETFVDSAEAVDDTTVRLALKSVAPAFVFTLRGLYTVPKAYTESLNDGPYAENAMAGAPIAVGPYRLTENEIGSHILFEAYDDYFLGVPRTKLVRVAAVPELTTRIAQLQTGEMDIVHGLLADHISTVEDIDGAQLVRSEGAGGSELTFFDMMNPDSPFNNVMVRQALCHAVDRNSIIDNLYRGEAILQNSLFVKFPATIGYDEELANNEPFPYDVQKAKELLSAAGYEDGFDTEITTYDTTTSPGTPQMMEVVSEQLRQIGVNAPVRFMEAGQYVSLFREKELTGMGPISFGGNSPDFATVYQNHYLAGSAFSYDNWEEGDAMWEEIQATIDPDEREALSQELLRRLSRERVPNITLVAPNSLVALGPRVKAFPRPPAQPYLSNLDKIELA